MKMGKYEWSTLIVLIYMLPYLYFGMAQDRAHHSFLGYVLAIVATGALAYASRRFGSVYAVPIGNLLSLGISYYFVRMVGEGYWESYFKPLSPQLTVIIFSVLLLIPQAIVLLVTHFAVRRKSRVL
ncbi:hypothetical protein QWJ34_22780 [Saccharibacillus sp. CPCC 101409]|uniref:hypothetical protein n=1 Tax=Saccharibacillus sp. CPCC 101409 TaxID=3058041 RepID=UPI0026729AB0|nr:hypothetical protein [Saccharibacillus sp. CPCC 101409]MDO3412609.1 hypothetical protein [Saccharibacillus sp. CPCC 101409]